MANDCFPTKSWLSIEEARFEICKKLYFYSENREQKNSKTTKEPAFSREQLEAADKELFKAIFADKLTLYQRERSLDSNRTSINAIDFEDYSTWFLIVRARRPQRSPKNPAINHLTNKILEVLADDIGTLSYEISTGELVTKSSSTKSKARRQTKYDWVSAEAHIVDLLEHRGDISIDDDGGWTNLAAIEKELIDFFSSRNPNGVPARSLIRKHAHIARKRYLSRHSGR